jgi:hypothetical protein
MALFASIPVMLVLAAFGVPWERANGFFLLMVPVFGLGMGVWGYHEYQRGAGLEVIIERDRVTVGTNGRKRVLRFEDVNYIRLVPAGSELACILIPRSGRALRLPPEIVPFDIIRDALAISVIFQLLGRMDERLARGETVDLRISRIRLAVTTSRALGALLSGAAMLLNPLCFSLGLHFLRYGKLLIQQSLMGIRGGLVLERHGLRSPSKRNRAVIPWHLLELVQTDSIGLVLRSKERHRFALSALTDNYLPALRLINSRMN